MPARRANARLRSWSEILAATHLAFEVDSLEEFGKHIAALGYSYSDGPHLRPDGGGIAFVDAPEGYEIELIQRPKMMGL